MLSPFRGSKRPRNRIVGTSGAIPGANLQGPILDALGRIAWEKLSDPQRLDLLRVYAVLFNRTGKPADPGAGHGHH